MSGKASFSARAASLRGKLDEYLALTAYGLNTLELDVKDEGGQVGFVAPDLPKLARAISDLEGASKRSHA